MLCRGVLVVSVKQGADADADAGASSSAHLPHAVAIVFNPALVCSASCIHLPPSCRALFATHHHGLCSEPQLAALVQMGHMQSAVQPGRGLLPSYRLAAGPAPNGSCGIQVAAACGLPPSLLDRAAEVAQRAEQVGQPSGRTGGGSPEGRQPLQQLNTLQASQSPPAAKRRRLPPPASCRGGAAGGAGGCAGGATCSAARRAWGGAAAGSPAGAGSSCAGRWRAVRCIPGAAAALPVMSIQEHAHRPAALPANSYNARKTSDHLSINISNVALRYTVDCKCY